MAKIFNEDTRRAGLTINWYRSDDTTKHERRHLGFDVNRANGLFKVPIARWEALREAGAAIINSKGSRVQARKLTCLVGTVISIKLAWGPITQLHTRNIYHILMNFPSLNCWVAIDDEAHNEIFFWKDLSRLRFESNIWPCINGISITVATDAMEIGRAHV